MIAIVDIIGPIAFSTKAENKKAIDATTPMLKPAKEYASRNLQSTSLFAKIVIPPVPKTISSPVPSRIAPSPRLTSARKRINKKV